MNRKLILENGQEFIVKGFASKKEVISEIVFNTTMAGYQEIISDNSYAHQTIVMTFPLIGVYGINHNDFESVEPKLDCLIVKESIEDFSHYESLKKLEEFLDYYDVVGISDVDTRMLVANIREEGSMLCYICDVEKDSEQALKELREYKVSTDHVKEVSTKKPYKLEAKGFKLAVLDFGIKLNILRELQNLGFDITVLPYDSTIREIEAINADAIFLSNGPGDPRDLSEVIENIKVFQEKYPIFGICLGHQLIALANDCEVDKLKFGHRGGNHPVKNLKTDKIEFTSQNHSYAVSKVDENKMNVTHINVLDNTIEGLEHKNFNVFSVQYHPESAPGPVDSMYLFEEFKNRIIEFKGRKDA